MPRSPEKDRARDEWTAFAWKEFAAQLAGLEAVVRKLRDTDPDGSPSHPQVKLFATVLHLLHEVVPSDPAAPQFLLGNTLGTEYRHWRRAKFAQRFRLFFRFHSPARAIVYAWLNDESTLRKAGARTDPYVVFRRMLEAGRPPSNFAELLTESERLDNPK